MSQGQSSVSVAGGSGLQGQASSTQGHVAHGQSGSAKSKEQCCPSTDVVDNLHGESRALNS